MHIDQVTLLRFPKILDQRGNLSFFQNGEQIPFSMERVYWIYDVPGGEQRGGHAYQSLREVIVALSGSFDIILHDGVRERKITLNRSYDGVYVPPMIWRHMENFSTNSVAFIAADQAYNEQEYIRSFEAFKAGKR